MKRIATAAALIMLALPAGAAAAGSNTVTHSVNSRHHVIEVVDAGHVVYGYTYRGNFAKLHAGAVILFRRTGMTISRVSVSGHPAPSVMISVRVVRSGHRGLLLALGDGQGMRFSMGRIGRKYLRSRHDNPMAHIALGALAGLGNVG